MAAFGLSSNLEFAFEDSKSNLQGGNGVMSANPSRPLHEITISTSDKPKLLCKLTSLLSEIGLNIKESHAFSTSDGYSLDVFVVDGWPYEETEIQSQGGCLQLWHCLMGAINTEGLRNFLFYLLTWQLPYANLTPLQAAIGVVQKGLRPPIPKQAHPDIVALIEQCWQQDPSMRPEFSEIITILLNLSNMILEEKRSIKRRNSLEGASRRDDV
ncbi:serine-threonine/tyrosine-protein kinase catalytic domain-containing protein [Tanacetum coccineum]